MTWPVPAPGSIADRAASTYESNPALTGIDARSETSLAAIQTFVVEGSIFDLYLYQANCAQELMPDTAIDNLPRHGNIWGIPREQATAATGSVSVAGTPLTTVIPSDFQFTAPSGVLITTTASVTIGSTGVASLPVIGLASDNSASNLAAGTVLEVVSPLAGLVPQSATVELAADGVSGLSGGAPIEDIEAWRGRILARIRAPAMGGSVSDYEQWAKDAVSTVNYVKAYANFTGLGTVGVVIAGPGPRVSTSGEVTDVQTYIDGPLIRPVTAAVTVYAASLLPVNFTLHLNPDTPAIRAGVLSALQLAFQTDGDIGGTGYVSRWDAAISSTSGEYSHERTLPSADVVPSQTQILTLGTVTWV